MTIATIQEPIKEELQVIEEKTSAHTQRAQALMIESEDVLEEALTFIRDMKSLRKEIQSTFKPIIDKAKAAKAAADATRKEAVDQEARHLAPVDEAMKIINVKINTWDEKQRQIAEAEAQKERDRIARESEKRTKAALKKIAGWKGKIQDKQALKADLEEKLEDPEIGEEEAACIRAELETIESGIEKAVDAAEMAQQVAQDSVPDPSAIATHAGPTKGSGVQRRVTYNARVINPMAILKAIIAGTVPITVIDFKIGTIQSLRRQGVIIPGVNYKEDSKLV